MKLKTLIPSLYLATRCLCGAFFVVVSVATALAVRPVPENLGNGLDKIVESDLLLKAGKTAAFRGFATEEAAGYAEAALVDAVTGKYVVDVMPDGRVPLAQLQAAIQNVAPLFVVTALDTKYRRHGVIEGQVLVDDVARIARLEGVGAVFLQLKPHLNAGPSTAQGVNWHRVNRINKTYNPASVLDYQGNGMSIGVMSDSFDAAAATTDRAAADTAADELPTVTVLEDLALGQTPTDEGRGMCQIVHDVAPKAKIGFATAFTGDVGFANNIRALAGLPGFTKDAATQKGFKGDVVCDDVSYLDEPMFSDGVVAQAVNDVVAAGVTYCSSAANNWGTDGYASVFRPVPNGTGLTSNTNNALVGTNIDLTGVDPALYAGGFHNFNPNGLDVAQLVNTGGSNRRLVFQWNDPYDVSAPVIIEPPFFEADGASSAGSEMDFFPPPLVAGQAYVVRVNATSGDFDAIVRITDPNGRIIADQDSVVDETVTFFAPVSGQYKITVHPFAAMPPVYTQGTYHVRVNNASGTSRITQDFNLLFFSTSGQFLQAVATNNFANNRPIEITTALSLGNAQTQLVISRANTSAPQNAANQLKYVFFGNGASGLGPAEYWNPLAPVTFGHSAAAGANSVAAYANFRPNIPEDFTSPGPVTIYFDANNNRLATPEIRLKPDIAAADGSNTSFFPEGPVPFFGAPLIGDSQYDPDDFPNFYGTSAASPHCAALAALVMEAHGGTVGSPNALSPAQVKTILQRTTFPHDLDPYACTGEVTLGNGGKVTINVLSDNSNNVGTGQSNPNSFSVTYTGAGVLTALSFNPEGTAATGGNVTGGNFNGFMPADFLNPLLYKYTPGMVWNSNASTYMFGNSVALTSADVTRSTSNPAPPPSTNAYFWTLNFSFPNNNFSNGKIFRFNNGRSQQQDATSPQGLTVSALRRSGDYSADMLGHGVLIPEDPTGADVRPGMTFRATVVDGGTTYISNGRLTNNIGRGYSPLDGFGFINAEAAVAAPVPTLPTVVSRKFHAGKKFDIPLPAVNPRGIECRDGGGNRDFTMVFIFPNVLTSVDGAQVTGGAATISSSGIGSNPKEYEVNLTGVSNAQYVTVTLKGVTSAGTTDPVISGTMGMLLGDVDATTLVDGNDVSSVQGKTRQVPDANNFRMDVDCSGLIDGNDVSLTQRNTRNGLPAAGSATAPSDAPTNAPSTTPAEKKTKQPISRVVKTVRAQNR